MTRRYLPVATVLAALAVLSMMIGTSFASSSKFGVMTTGSNAGGYSDPAVGQSITGSAATNDQSITMVKFKWIEPDGNTVFQTDTVSTSTPAGGASCLTDASKYTGGVRQSDVSNSGSGFKCFADHLPLPAVTGDWGMQATFCTSDQSCMPPQKVDIKAVSFFVLPESAFGALALMTASVAALGGFVVLRSRHLPKTSLT